MTHYGKVSLLQTSTAVILTGKMARALSIGHNFMVKAKLANEARWPCLYCIRYLLMSLQNKIPGTPPQKNPRDPHI